MMQQEFRVAEIVSTIQGEGWWTGLPVTLLRLQGCNLKPLCPFCDTKYALSKTGGELVSLERLSEILKKYHPKRRTILLTGGEPAMQPLQHLVPFLTSLGPVHLETNGTLPIGDVCYAWVTVSPKPPHKLDPTTLGRADEIKWLIDSEDDVAALCAFLKGHKSKWIDHKRICAQPLSQDRKATTIAVAACLKYGWRLSIQVHKLLEVP